MWIGATFYDGQIPLPSPGQDWLDFAHHLFDLVRQEASPTSRAWLIYWSFFIVEALM